DGLSSDVPLVEFINPNETNITQNNPRQHQIHNPRNISLPTSSSITSHDDDIFSRDHGDQQANTMPSFLSRRVTTGSDDNEENYVEMSDLTKSLSLTSEFAFDNIDDSDTAKLTKNRVDYTLEKKNTQISFDNQDEDDSHDPRLLSRMPSFKKFRRLSKMVTRASSRVVNLANVPLDQLSKEGDLSDDKIFSDIQQRNSTSSEAALNNQSLETPSTISKGKSVLEGRSLFIFGPNNPLRIFFYEILSNP
ncbi:22359_t:CDS:1, partial [Racocetra persica]